MGQLRMAGPAMDQPRTAGPATARPQRRNTNGANKGPNASGGNKGPGLNTGNKGPSNGAGKPGGAGTAHSAIKSGPAPKGSNEHVTKSGSAVRTRPNGKVSDVHDAKRGMDVHHGLNGGRRVSVERHDGSRVVAERGRRGYVERGYRYHGHDFARRSPTTTMATNTTGIIAATAIAACL